MDHHITHSEGLQDSLSALQGVARNFERILAQTRQLMGLDGEERRAAAAARWHDPQPDFEHTIPAFAWHGKSSEPGPQ